MTICDLCKKNIPTKVYTFGDVITEWRNLPHWDFCDECQNRILNKINKFISSVRPELDDKDYLFNNKYNAD